MRYLYNSGKTYGTEKTKNNVNRVIIEITY